jgi:hypothetical protein
MLLAPRGGLAITHLERTAPLPSDASAQTHSASFCEARVGSTPCTSRVVKNGRSGMLLAPRGGLANAHLERTAPLPSDASAQTHLRPASQSAWVRSPCTSRVIKNGRSGIRTHAGFRPHDFQSCALSHSAIRPERAVTAHGWERPTEGVGCSTPPRRRRGVGSESQDPTAQLLKRREWDAPRCARRPRERAPGAHARAIPSDASARTHSTIFFEARVGSSPRTSQHMSNGGSGIRTHEVLSDQRLSRAPP